MPQGQPRERHVIVSVIDADTGRPVKGLPARLFAVREDNLERQVVKVAPATEPVSVVFFADTTTAFSRYIGEMRHAAQTFLAGVLSAHPRSTAALWQFSGVGMPVVTFTHDTAKLEKGATRLVALGPVGPGAASDLLEGVADAARQLARRPEPRRVIVSVDAAASPELSSLPGQEVQRTVQQAQARWFAVTVEDATSNEAQRNQVLAVLCPLSGGMRTTILSVSALDSTLANIADIVASQYELTYLRPSGAANRLQVGLRIAGAKVLAPSWAPR